MVPKMKDQRMLEIMMTKTKCEIVDQLFSFATALSYLTKIKNKVIFNYMRLECFFLLQA